jgi:hypothetical protein
MSDIRAFVIIPSVSEVASSATSPAESVQTAYSMSIHIFIYRMDRQTFTKITAKTSVNGDRDGTLLFQCDIVFTIRANI